MLQYKENRTRGTEDFPVSPYVFRYTSKVVEPHWHPEIEIIYMVEGEMTANVSEEKYVIKPGDIFFVNPEEVHMFIVQEPVVYYAIVFFPDIFRFKGVHFFEREFTNPIMGGAKRFPRLVCVSQKEYNDLQPMIHRMFYEHMTSKPLLFSDLTTLFCVMLEQNLLQDTRETQDYQHSDAVKVCIKYMEENYARKITLSEIAELVHMSSNYFCQYFKRHTGITPFKQLHLIRVREATAALQETEDSVVTIAEACGFENVSFFIRKFKELTGETPSAYRKRLR